MSSRQLYDQLGIFICHIICLIFFVTIFNANEITLENVNWQNFYYTFVLQPKKLVMDDHWNPCSEKQQ